MRFLAAAAWPCFGMQGDHLQFNAERMQEISPVAASSQEPLAGLHGPSVAESWAPVHLCVPSHRLLLTLDMLFFDA